MGRKSSRFWKKIKNPDKTGVFYFKILYWLMNSQNVPRIQIIASKEKSIKDQRGPQTCFQKWNTGSHAAQQSLESLWIGLIIYIQTPA
jgi:hypothetical protein